MLLTLMLLTFDVSKLPTIDTSNYSYNMSRFAAAGQVVSNEALNAFNSVLNTSPDYAALQMEAMKNKAAKEIVSNKVESELFKDAIQSIAERKSDDIRIKSNLELLGKGPKQKMAGKLALMGSLIAEAAIKPKKVDLPNNIPFDRSADIAKAQAAIDASTEKIDALKALILQSKTTGDVPTNNGTPSTPVSVSTTPSTPVSVSTTPSTPVSVSTTPSDGSAITSWDQAYNLAKATGAKFPQLVAAQWAHESAYGTALGGSHNYFGMKSLPGQGNNSPTHEYSNGKPYNTNADFLNFNSAKDAFETLNKWWHDDYKNFSGVSQNTNSASAAAQQLQAQKYATDPGYANALIRIMGEHGY